MSLAASRGNQPWGLRVPGQGKPSLSSTRSFYSAPSSASHVRGGGQEGCLTTQPIVPKVWSFCCTTLRDDGVSYGDYLEQLTYLIFLKMADEYATPPYNRNVGIPTEYDWSPFPVSWCGRCGVTPLLGRR